MVKHGNGDRFGVQQGLGSAQPSQPGQARGHAGGHLSVPSHCHLWGHTVHSAEGPQHPQKPDVLLVFCLLQEMLLKLLIQLAGIDACAIIPFMSPGCKPGLRHNEELWTVGDLKWFACLQLSGETSWLQTKAAHCDVQSTVQNMGWRTFGAPLVAHTAVHWSCFEPQN